MAGIVVALIAAAIGDTPNTAQHRAWRSSCCSALGVFLYAMRWDSSDPARISRRSDVAFWLHLLAAPMIVHPVFTLLGLNDGDATVGEGLVVIAIYVALGIAALAIDRRALLVSALAYVLFALNELFETLRRGQPQHRADGAGDRFGPAAAVGLLAPGPCRGGDAPARRPSRPPAEPQSSTSLSSRRSSGARTP